MKWDEMISQSNLPFTSNFTIWASLIILCTLTKRGLKSQSAYSTYIKNNMKLKPLFLIWYYLVSIYKALVGLVIVYGDHSASDSVYKVFLSEIVFLVAKFW